MLPRKCNGELKNFSASLDDLMPYYKPNLPVANSISGETEIFYPQMYKFYSLAENYKNLSHDCRLILNFDAVNQILAHLTGAKIQSMLLKSTTKIDCKSIVSTLMKNPITHENMFKFRSKSTDLIIKKEIALTLLEDLLTLYITSGHLLLKKARYKVKFKQSRLKSRSLRTSLKKMDFQNWQLFLTIKTAIFIAANI